MNSWAFSQLNQLTPSPSLGNSPVNGPASDLDRNDSSLSFPVSGADLQAQLEAWTSVAFDFDSSEFTNPSKGLARNLGFHDPQYALHGGATLDDGSAAPGVNGATGFSDPYGADLYSIPASFTDPSLALPPLAPAPAGTPTTPASAAHQASPSQPQLSATNSTSTPSATHATPSAAAGSAKKRRQSSSGAEAASAPAKPMTDEELNQVAIEEDKRRRNTAASARFRIKKKQREAALEASAKELRDRVNYLEKEVDALRTENGWLRGLIVGKEEAEKRAALEAEAAANGVKMEEQAALSAEARRRARIENDGESGPERELAVAI